MISAAKVFDEKFRKKHLVEVFTSRISESGVIGIDRVRASSFSERLDDEVDLILKRVQSGGYRFTAYKEKLISKGAGSHPRQISIPTVRDRLVLRSLCDCLGEIFPDRKLRLPHTVIESLASALSSGKYKEFAKIDLQGFYPSIPHKLIGTSIWRRARKPQLRGLIEKAIRTPTVPEARGQKGAPPSTRGVPQGLAISNLLAEIAMEKFDDEFRNISGIWYSRYVDDILVLTAEGRAEDVACQMIHRLKKMGLTAHPPGPGSKTRIAPLTESFSFLGYEISGSEVRVKRDSVLRFESSVARILTAYIHKVKEAKTKVDRERALAYCKWKLNLRISGCVFRGKRLGWVAYFSQITTTAQLRGLNYTVAKLISRFKLDGEIKPKSLIKTFYELKRKAGGDSGYIPNFDSLTPSQKRERLAMWLGDRVVGMTDEKVDRILAVKISKAVKDLEADIAQTS
jgi:RNA-directed DNA polymerase